MSCIVIEVMGTKGSTPRDAGTVMSVSLTRTIGTIGGGALEHRAIAQARRMLVQGQARFEEILPLGPGLGQCCGGSVSLRYGRGDMIADASSAQPLSAALTPPARMPLWIWGAGHVGRAVVDCAASLPAFDMTWVDTAADRFPQNIAESIAITPTPDMPRLAAHAPRDAHHLIFTYSHDIDLALCAALLQRGFASCGLIGSATKWARFQKRLKASGLNPASITCPIGDPSRGKHPDDIAHSTLSSLLRLAHPHPHSAAKRATRLL